MHDFLFRLTPFVSDSIESYLYCPLRHNFEVQHNISLKETYKKWITIKLKIEITVHNAKKSR